MRVLNNQITASLASEIKNGELIMPVFKFKPVESLLLDLRNFRTVPQTDENRAINAIISINPDWFWALMESIIDEGYHFTENIIVQDEPEGMLVREGNRRIAILKLIFNYVINIEIPENLEDKIKALPPDWKTANSQVPCAIYSPVEKQVVDKLVALTHAKGEKAGRDKWTAVARARHARDEKGESEPGLDLLEKYLGKGRNLSLQQAERWAGDYPLTVLNEALQKLAPKMIPSSVKEISIQYPNKNKKIIDNVLYDIGNKQLKFEKIRDREKYFGLKYGVGIPQSSGTTTATTSHTESSASKASEQNSNNSAQTARGHAKRPAYASNDPKSVIRQLKRFTPLGNGREKLVTLLNESRNIKIDKCPHAFCFLLRSLFELSAKAYCSEHKSTGGPKYKKTNGEDKYLVDILSEITNHLTGNNTNRNKIQELHGAMAELAKKNGVLSVTSLNQLVHNPSFTVSPSDICSLFGNVYPLLEEMNR
jgi:hypothetical protein